MCTLGGYAMPRKIGLKVMVMELALIGLWSGAVIAQNANPKPVKPKITLHDQARKAGGKLVLKYKPNRGTIYPNVAELAKRCDLIVVGRVVSHKANLSPDERFITQDFLVKVQEVIKGDSPTGAALLVRMPGGTHRFPDGGFAVMAAVG